MPANAEVRVWIISAGQRASIQQAHIRHCGILHNYRRGKVDACVQVSQKEVPVCRCPTHPSAQGDLLRRGPGGASGNRYGRYGCKWKCGLFRRLYLLIGRGPARTPRTRQQVTSGKYFWAGPPRNGCRDDSRALSQRRTLSPLGVQYLTPPGSNAFCSACRRTPCRCSRC